MRRLPVLLFCLLIGIPHCASRNRITVSHDCDGPLPRDIPGLVVSGARPRDNVIVNPHGIRCAWRKRCIRDNRQDLRGTIHLKLIIDKTGDIGVVEFHHNAEDSAFVQSLVDGLYLDGFDPWFDDPEDTEIECAIALCD